MSESQNSGTEAMETFTKKILPDLKTTPIPLSLNELNGILAECELNDVKDAMDLREKLEAMPRGVQVRDFVQNSLRLKNLSFVEGQLNKLSKHEKVAFFFHIFQLDDQAADAQASPGTDSAETIEKPEKPIKPHSRKDMDFSMAQNIYDRGSRVFADEIDKNVDFPEEIQLYKDLAITGKDRKEMFFGQPDKFYFGCVLLANPETGRVEAIGRMEEISFGDESRGTRFSPVLVFDAKDIHYDAFREQSKFELVLLPKEEEDFYLNGDLNKYNGKIYPVREKLSVTYNELPEADRPLCIDFGTSNTTAGTYVDNADGKREMELVTWQDNTGQLPVFRDILPTMVYTESIQAGAPNFLFGYDAQKKLVEHDYAPEATFFFEIKRWLNTLDGHETIRDEKGRPMTTSHREIIYAYLNYIKSVAEHHFKMRFTSFHFTAPIRQKEVFIEAIRETFARDNLTVFPVEESLDEGMAIVYRVVMHKLARDHKDGKPKNKDKMNILILDCGGGTTDLTHCQCEYEAGLQGDTLRITTGFENGDSNFGGNNLTYRLLQMLKIKIASKLVGKDKIFHGQDPENQNKVLEVQELIDMDENLILAHIDDANADNRDIYAKFDDAYREAEKYVPTRFALSSKNRERTAIRRNFNYLWKMAEAIKIEFFKSNLVKLTGEDYKIYVDNPEQYYLSVRKTPDGALERLEKPASDIAITVKEIERMLYPDLYMLLNNLLPPTKDQDNQYCLSGQSCKINLFGTLLKEFIPGKDLRRGVSSSSNAYTVDSSALKKYCIQGSIEYVRDRASGTISPVINKGAIKDIYNIYFQDSKSEKPTFLCAPEEGKQITLLHRPITTQDLNFVIRDGAKGEKKNTINYKINRADQLICDDLPQLIDRLCDITHLSRSQLVEEIQKPIVNLDDDFKEGVKSFIILTLPSRHGYGVRIVQIGLVKEEYDKKLHYVLSDNSPFYPYENDKMLTFFEGDK